MPPSSTPAASSRQQSAASARWALASLSLTMLLSSLGTSSANVALPTLAKAFNASFQDVQWIVLAYLLAITTVIVSVGRLGDVIGRRRLMLAGLFLFTAASALCGAAPALWMLIAARAVQGLGAAIMMALSMAFVGGAIPKERTGSAMGLLGTMSAVGTALGPSLGGVLIASLGWRSIFFINLPLGLLALLLAWRYLPVDRQASKTVLWKKSRTSFDSLGTVLLALTLAVYALAMTMGRGRPGLLNVALLSAAVFGVCLFARVEAKAASPLIRLAMFRNPLLSAGFMMSTLVTTVVMATLVVGPFYLSGALALDAAHVGLVMSAGPIVAALTGVPAGRLVDRLGAHRTTIAGLIAMAIGCSILTVAATRFGAMGYIVPLVVVTAGYALFQAANNTAVMTGTGQDQRGVVSGMLNLSRNLGLITGASVMGAVFALGSEAADITTALPEAVATGMRITFAVAVLLIFAAIAIASASRALSRRAYLIEVSE
ncbi:MAG: MFS transporter [Luteimonas sp.]